MKNWYGTNIYIYPVPNSGLNIISILWAGWQGVSVPLFMFLPSCLLVFLSAGNLLFTNISYWQESQRKCNLTAQILVQLFFLGGVIDGSFIANVKICIPFFLFWHINVLVLHNMSWSTEDNRALMCLMALYQSWSMHQWHQLGWQKWLD